MSLRISEISSACETVSRADSQTELQLSACTCRAERQHHDDSIHRHDVAAFKSLYHLLQVSDRLMILTLSDYLHVTPSRSVRLLCSQGQQSQCRREGRQHRKRRHT